MHMLEIEPPPDPSDHEETDALVETGTETKSVGSGFTISSRWKKFIAALLVACVFMFFYDAEVEEEEKLPDDVIGKDGVDDGITKITGAILNKENLAQIVEQQVAQFVRNLQQDYPSGANFTRIFQYPIDGEMKSVGRSAFASPNSKSWFRMKRKLIIKILTAKIEEHNQRNKNYGHSDSQPANDDSATKLQPHQEAYYDQFVWANGGHR
jgi:hypothetical protein